MVVEELGASAPFVPDVVAALDADPDRLVDPGGLADQDLVAMGDAAAFRVDAHDDDAHAHVAVPVLVLLAAGVERT